MIYTTVAPGFTHYIPVNEKRSAFSIWSRVFGFYLDHLPALLVILPLLFVPVFTDALHTVLIHQHVKQRVLRMGDGLKQALKATMPLLEVKMAFWWRSTLWGMIPLIGWVKDAQLRVAWGMTSNVMLLEGASDTACRMRCEDISRHADPSLLVRSLITVPVLLYVITVVLYVIAEQLVGGGWLFALWIVFAFWIALPASAAANTFAYLDVVPLQRSNERS
jgi:hypothetical protein